MGESNSYAIPHSCVSRRVLGGVGVEKYNGARLDLEGNNKMSVPSSGISTRDWVANKYLNPPAGSWR